MAQLGQSKGDHLELVRNLTPEEIQRSWPQLKPANHKVTSRATRRYNCIAFALGDERTWWEADEGFGGGIHWPDGVPDTLDGWVQIFTREQFEPTADRNVEAGVEKIAIYVSLRDMSPEHVAVSDGRSWKSKLGRYQDIEHRSLDLPEGENACEYGIVAKILRRPVRSRTRKRGKTR
jgi:hypothetical protein